MPGNDVVGVCLSIYRAFCLRCLLLLFAAHLLAASLSDYPDSATCSKHLSILSRNLVQTHVFH